MQGKALMRVWGLVLMALLLASGVAQAVTWPNMPVGSTIVTECAWSNLCPGWTDPYNALSIQSDGVANTIGSAPMGQRDFLPGAAAEGGSQLDYHLANPTKDIYIGVVLRSNTDFSGNYNSSNKIFLIISDDTPSVIGAYGTGSGGLLFAYNNQNFGNLNNCHLAKIAGDCPGGVWFTPTGTSKYLVRGSYQKLELRLKSSTTDTSQDGWIKMWVDGVQVYNITNANTGDAPWKWFSWNHTWTGLDCTNRDCTKDREWWFDHVVIADSTGGSAPPASPPPPPPPQSGNYPFASQFSGTQGQNQWSYRDTAGNLLTYDAIGSIWRGDQTYLAIWQGGFHHGATGSPRKGAVLRWTAPANGTADISGTARLYEATAGAKFEIKYNATSLFSQTMSPGVSYPYSKTQAVAAGDTIDFILTEVMAGVNNNTQLNPVINFTQSGGGASPTVTSFTPTSGDVGQTVTITGTNFGTTVAANVVKFNGVVASCTGASATSLTCNMPQGATTGAITVTTSVGTGTSGSNFTVTTATPTKTVSVFWSYSGLDVNGNKETVDHFEILRSATFGGTYAQIGTAPAASRKYVDTDAPLSKAYYKVRVVDASSNVSSASVAVGIYEAGVTPDSDTTAPEAPFSIGGAYR